MKKHYLFILLLFCLGVFGQETAKKPFSFKPEFYFGFSAAVFQGDNYLAKEHKSTGFGGLIKANLVRYRNMKLGIVLDRTSVRLSDDVLAIARTNINSLGGVFSHSFTLDKKWSIAPEISFSASEVKQKSADEFYSFGTHYGNKLSAGLNVKYKIFRQIGTYAAVHYSHYNFKVATTPEFENYFDHTKTLTFSVGFTVL